LAGEREIQIDADRGSIQEQSGFCNGLKGFCNSLRRDLQDVEGIRNALYFLLVFAASFILMILVIIPITSPFWSAMGSLHAGAAQWILSEFGIESQTNANVLVMDVQGKETHFLISRLCSGDIETALLISLIIASLDILLVWRILGVLVGTVLLLSINPLRIALTLAITKNSGMATGDLYHNIIFRLFLFVILVLYYFAWYRIFAGRRCRP